VIIAQITDLHVGFHGSAPDEPNKKRLETTLAELASLTVKPDLVLATGDLSDKGDAQSYRDLMRIFAASGLPVYPALGNHDSRATFREVFSDALFHEGFLQYVLEDWPVRIVVLDTLEEGAHGGGFDVARAAWLDRQLSAAPDRPTLVALHHPPFPSDIPWLTTQPQAGWAARVEAVIARHAQVVRVISGHIHRAIFRQWAGTLAAVCASTSPQVALEMADMDAHETDNRRLIVAEPASYMLHVWRDGVMQSHCGVAGDFPVLARYDPVTHHNISHIMLEEPVA
jgi:3',5'-cyclic AMP phosphodiesterase CpdA